MARTRARSLQNDDNNHKAAAVAEQEDAVQSARKDRPTPSARDIKPRGTGSTGLINRIPVVRTLVAYFRGVISEMRKVTWPSREETTRLTTVVLGVTIAFAIGLGTLDAFFGWWFQQAFHADSEWIFLVVAAVVSVVAGGTVVAMRRYV